MAAKGPHDAILRDLRAFGLGYPGAHYKSPWPTHMDLAVNDKTFSYLSLEGEPLSISCKLPHSAGAALMLPFCKPTGYGLGKSGWVSASFGPDDAIDVDMLRAWIDESYRAQAPKKFVRALDETPARDTSAAARKKTARAKGAATPTSKKAARRKKGSSAK